MRLKCFAENKYPKSTFKTYTVDTSEYRRTIRQLLNTAHQEIIRRFLFFKRLSRLKMFAIEPLIETISGTISEKLSLIR